MNDRRAADDTLVVNAVRIRPLADTDLLAWLSLWRGYLAFYGCTLPDEVTEHTWQRSIAPDEQPYAWVAEAGDGQLVGFVIYHFHLSTWSIGGDCYLEDLFVAAHARGKGAGYALIEAVYRAATEHGATRVYWNTHADNTRARALYDRVAQRSPFVRYQFELPPHKKGDESEI